MKYLQPLLNWSFLLAGGSCVILGLPSIATSARPQETNAAHWPTASSLSSLTLLINLPGEQSSPSARTTSPIGMNLLKLIAEAKSSIDVAVYGLRNQDDVLAALVDAQQRGVRLRVVVDQDVEGDSYYTDTHSLKDRLGAVRSDHAVDVETSKNQKELGYKPFWKAPRGFAGPPQCVGYSLADRRAVIAVHASREELSFKGDIMHHKFAIIDSAIVWTGSCNVSDSGTGGYNANAALVIRSKVVAGWYTNEFNAMYERGLYHHKKRDLRATDQRRVVLDDGVTIRLGFSPQDQNYLNVIRPALRNAQETIDVAMFFLTHKLIAADLINAHQRGVRVRVIIDATAATNGYTKHELLRVAGIPVKVESWGGKMHMKCALVDGRHLVAGSMNWTSAGERSNDENTVLVSSTTVGHQFQSAFEKMWVSIPDRWLSGRPDPESRDSVGSDSDGVDNDFDGLVDGDDPGCGESPPSLSPLPPYKVVPLADGNLLIKGNIGRDGRKIYHLPSGQYYEATRISRSRGERWFPSIWEAKGAGWTASKR